MYSIAVLSRPQCFPQYIFERFYCTTWVVQ